MINLNPNTMPEREQYSARLLKAKADFRNIFRNTSEHKPRYASVLMSEFPDAGFSKDEIYRALNDHQANWKVLEKFEHLIDLLSK